MSNNLLKEMGNKIALAKQYTQAASLRLEEQLKKVIQEDPQLHQALVGEKSPEAVLDNALLQKDQSTQFSVKKGAARDVVSQPSKRKTPQELAKLLRAEIATMVRADAAGSIQKSKTQTLEKLEIKSGQLLAMERRFYGPQHPLLIKLGRKRSQVVKELERRKKTEKKIPVSPKTLGRYKEIKKKREGLQQIEKGLSQIADSLLDAERSMEANEFQEIAEFAGLPLQKKEPSQWGNQTFTGLLKSTRMAIANVKEAISKLKNGLDNWDDKSPALTEFYQVLETQGSTPDLKLAKDLIARSKYSFKQVLSDAVKKQHSWRSWLDKGSGDQTIKGIFRDKDWEILHAENMLMDAKPIANAARQLEASQRKYEALKSEIEKLELATTSILEELGTQLKKTARSAKLKNQEINPESSSYKGKGKRKAPSSDLVAIKQEIPGPPRAGWGAFFQPVFSGFKEVKQEIFESPQQAQNSQMQGLGFGVSSGSSAAKAKVKQEIPNAVNQSAGANSEAHHLDLLVAAANAVERLDGVPNSREKEANQGSEFKRARIKR